MTNPSSPDSPSLSLDIKDNRTGKKYVVPIFRNAVRALDFKKIICGSMSSCTTDLPAEGLRVIDEGFRNTAPVLSKISHLDPGKGSLQYRNRDIADLIDGEYGFEECTYLLVKGTIPTGEQRDNLKQELCRALRSPPTVLNVIQSFPRDAPSIMIIMAGLSAWASSDPSSIPVVCGTDIYGKSNTLDASVVRTLGALGSVISIVYCHQNDLALKSPRAQYTFVENLLSMMSLVDENTRKPREGQVKGLEKLLILHAEHGMCNATAAFLHCASTRADPISCLIAALTAIYGPLHGGSNIITYRQMQKLGKVENIPALIESVKSGKQRLFGFGHRIYRAEDPRATILRSDLQQAIREDKDVPYLEVALKLDDIVSTDTYFTSRNLKANTDLYTVIAYQAIGIPEQLVFPFICVSRAQGFLAHWREFMHDNPPTWRPQQIFTGQEAKCKRSNL